MLLVLHLRLGAMELLQMLPLVLKVLSCLHFWRLRASLQTFCFGDRLPLLVPLQVFLLIGCRGSAGVWGQGAGQQTWAWSGLNFS